MFSEYIVHTFRMYGAYVEQVWRILDVSIVLVWSKFSAYLVQVSCLYAESIVLTCQKLGAYFSRILTGFWRESLLNLLPSSYWSQASILTGQEIAGAIIFPAYPCAEANIIIAGDQIYLGSQTIMLSSREIYDSKVTTLLYPGDVYSISARRL